MLRLSDDQFSNEQLQKILQDYEGKEIDLTELTRYKRSSMKFFTEPNFVSDARVEFTSQLNITSVYATYLLHFAQEKDATFGAFVKWHLLQAMQGTPFTWRYLDKKWYVFDNLPLEVTARRPDDNQMTCMIDNASKMDWPTFVKAHAGVARGQFQDILADPNALPLWAIAHEIVGLHIPRMTHYKTSHKEPYTHQPWFVFSDRYKDKDEQLYMPLHVSISHAQIRPSMAEDLIKKFMALASNTPMSRPKL